MRDINYKPDISEMESGPPVNVCM